MNLFWQYSFFNFVWLVSYTIIYLQKCCQTSHSLWFELLKAFMKMTRHIVAFIWGFPLCEAEKWKKVQYEGVDFLLHSTTCHFSQLWPYSKQIILSVLATSELPLICVPSTNMRQRCIDALVCKFAYVVMLSGGTSRSNKIHLKNTLGEKHYIMRRRSYISMHDTTNHPKEMFCFCLLANFECRTRPHYDRRSPNLSIVMMKSWLANFFSQDGVTAWNGLPALGLHASAVDKFKREGLQSVAAAGAQSQLWLCSALICKILYQAKI